MLKLFFKILAVMLRLQREPEETQFMVEMKIKHAERKTITNFLIFLMGADLP